MEACILEPTFAEVEWIDTDESEDEDYLPPTDKEASYSSSLRSTSTTDFFDQLKDEIEINPFEKVRRVIDYVVDNGIEKVDLGHIGLSEIPREVGELEYVTVLCNDTVKTASLQLYLYRNQLSCLNSHLFRLKNLTVLSLRNNQLQSIPPDIALLENLVELSLGNNQLKSLPAELLRLRKLRTLSLFPNPYFENDNQSRQRIMTKVPSLVEISSRQIQSQSIQLSNSIIPTTLIQRFQTFSKCTRYDMGLRIGKSQRSLRSSFLFYFLFS
ncbi:hypothetical protein G6F68_007466 [Rhizopus microsporus]|nr:hypothetical protein G6F68_007466 [Rhizopus microsporus]